MTKWQYIAFWIGAGAVALAPIYYFLYKIASK